MRRQCHLAINCLFTEPVFDKEWEPEMYKSNIIPYLGYETNGCILFLMVAVVAILNIEFNLIWIK